MGEKTKKTLRPRLLSQAVLVILALFLCTAVGLKISDNPSLSAMQAQITRLTQYNFIRKIAPMAKEEETRTGLKASITLAQACVESDFGLSSLASKYHNLFGIKAYGGVPAVTLDTTEYVKGKKITIAGHFRTYSSWEDSVRDHTNLFVTGVDWDPGHYQNVLTADSYTAAAQALQSDGYATDPAYTKKIIQTIQSYHLADYDKS